MSELNIIDEKRAHLNEEIYGILGTDQITFVHEDTTVYPTPISLKYVDLVPGKLYDYEVTEEDLIWLNDLIVSLDFKAFLL